MDHISTWTNEDVLKWSCQVVRLSQSTIDSLREHNIDGMMLVTWSEDKLQTALGLRNVSNNNNDWKEIQYLRFQNSMLDLSTAVDLNREMIEEVEASGYPPVDKAALNVLKTMFQPEIQQMVDDFEFACGIQEQDFDPQFYNDLDFAREQQALFDRQRTQCDSDHQYALELSRGFDRGHARTSRPVKSVPAVKDHPISSMALRHISLPAATMTQSQVKVTEVDSLESPGTTRKTNTKTQGLVNFANSLNVSKAKKKCDVCISEQSILYTHSCGHINCKGCLKQLFRTALRDITMLPLRCCEVEIDLTPVKSLLNEDEAALLLQRNSESKVKEKMHCPQCNLFINLDNLNTSQRKNITCTGCLTSLCSECRTRSHQFRTCSENKADNQSTSDKAVFNLASSKGWKQCPMCRVIIELEYGCNHMTCSFCRFHFCFKCLKPWSTATGKCSSGACEVWDAKKLIQAGDDRIVNEELVLGRQYQPEERVARQMVHVRALRSNETCRHTWVRRNGNQGACEACGYSLWLYGMVCQGACNATVCYTCARHRIAAIGWR